jgi:hypothetical protein
MFLHNERLGHLNDLLCCGTLYLTFAKMKPDARFEVAMVLTEYYLF